MERAISALGVLVFLAISYALSVNRRAIRWRTVAWGLGLEFTFALLILKTPGGLVVFKALKDVVSNFLAFSDVGAKFVFGDNFKEHLFAFQVLPTIIFFSAFISVLYYYGILQRVVNGLAWVMMKTMKTSGSESLSCAGNIFLGASGKISPRAVIIATYALCNFANIGSIGITIGGIAGMARDRQQDLARMGVKAMIGGLLAGFITASIAGMLV